jgi:hypothetical protein
MSRRLRPTHVLTISLIGAAISLASAAYAAFTVDPSFLADFGGKGLRHRTAALDTRPPQAAQSLTLAVGADSPAQSATVPQLPAGYEPAMKQAALLKEADSALSEFHLAWEQLSKANEHMNSVMRAMAAFNGGDHPVVAAAADAAAQPSGAPTSTTVGGVLFSGSTKFPQPSFVLAGGSYSRAQFLAAVLPRGYKTTATGHGPFFPSVKVDDDTQRTWPEWLDYAGKRSGTFFAVSYRRAEVSYSNPEDGKPVAARQYLASSQE